MSNKKYRLDLNFEELKSLKNDEKENFLDSLKNKIDNVKIINESEELKEYHERRAKDAKDKIWEATTILMKRGEKLSKYKISQESGVAYKTCRKYISDSWIKEKNKEINED